ncbi:MAG: bpX6 domain-containing protein [Blastocatellia bacterium]
MSKSEMAKLVRPRAAAWRGAIRVSGIYFDTTLIGEAEARRRLIDLWTPGARVWRIDEAETRGLLLRLAAPLRMVCGHMSGAPLAEIAGALWAMPLSEAERRAIAPPPDTAVLMRGGVALPIALTADRQEAPELWLDVNEYVAAHVHTLAAPPAPPQVVVEPVVIDARARLGAIGAAPPELEKLLAEYKTEKDGKRSGSGQEAAMGEGLAAARAWLRALVERLTGRGADSGGAGADQRGKRVEAPPVNQTSGAWARSLRNGMRGLRALFARTLAFSRLSQLPGRRHAEYLTNMMEMFERGEMDEALRHAIPLGGSEGADNLRGLLSRLAPRASLNISMRTARGGPALGLGENWYQTLTQMYRDAFRRLEAQGRLEEAAYVLAELLRENEQAVAFLERHGKLRLAAELAEGRGLAPALVVRQWFVAGDRERAIRMARRHGVFYDAIMRLERSSNSDDKKHAVALRLLWAGTLAEAGDYEAAVTAAWPVPEARALSLTWMEQALAQGGLTAARMLAYKLANVPRAYAEARAQALTLLDDDEAENRAAKIAFAEALQKSGGNARTRVIARAAVRALARDTGAGGATPRNDLVGKLLDFAGDNALRADLPRHQLQGPLLRAETSLRTRAEPLRLEFAETDVGTLALHEAALLPGGRLIVALGEAGARLSSREGKVIAHFDQPAYRLVIADNGARAIAIAPRGQVKRLARVDFLARTARGWCEVEITAFADDYDGSMWLVGAQEDLYAIDATAKRFDALWRVGEAGIVRDIARSQRHTHWLIDVGEGWGDFEKWTYESPSLILRGREKAFIAGHSIRIVHQVVITPAGIVVSVGKIVETGEEEAGVWLEFHFAEGRESLMYRLAQVEAMPLQAQVTEQWIAVVLQETGHVCVLLLDMPANTDAKTGIRAEIILRGAASASVKFSSDTGLGYTMIIADDRGRLLVMSLRDGRLLRDLRL